MYAVLFDIDGTLLLAAGAGKAAYEEAFDEEFGVPKLPDSIHFAGRSDRGITIELMELYGIEPSEANWERFRRTYLEKLRGTLPRHKGYVLPGVERLLEALGGLPDVLLGLITGNIRGGAEQKLVHYKLWDWFTFGGYGDEHTDRDLIAREALDRAVEVAGLRTLRGVMVIGDTPNDVRCARAIGAVAVAVDTSSIPTEELRASEPDLLLATLEDHASILDLIASNGQAGSVGR